MSFFLAQWTEYPPSVWEAMGSIPVSDSDFPFSHTHVMLISLLHRLDSLIRRYKKKTKSLFYAKFSFSPCKFMQHKRLRLDQNGKMKGMFKS